MAAVRVTGPLPVPEAGLTDNQVALALAFQLKVPPPVLLMLTVCAKGLLPPCWAVKDRLVGLIPIAGLTGTTGAEGGVISCANPGISAANLLIDRPPVLPFPAVEEFPAPAAASGMTPVDVAPTAMDPVVVTDDGATLMVARGTAAPTVLLNDDAPMDWEAWVSLCSDVGEVGTELRDEELDGEGSTDAIGAFCGFRISRCGVLVNVCVSFFSKDFVGWRRLGGIFSMRRPCVPIPSVVWMTVPVSCWAETVGRG